MNKGLNVALMCLLVVFLAGCADGDISSTGGDTIFTGRNNYNIVCIDGVSYYENIKRLAPAFNRDGTLKLCDN